MREGRLKNFIRLYKIKILYNREEKKEMYNMYNDAPPIIRDFLNYMETIKGKSKNTVKEYFYDLRLFIRFIKQYKNLVPHDMDFESINIADANIDLIKSVTLSDLYEFMSFLSRERDNNPSSRARKVASMKSFFNYLSNKVKLLDYNHASELEYPKLFKRLHRY